MTPAYAAQGRNGRGAAAPQLCRGPACLIKITFNKERKGCKEGAPQLYHRRVHVKKTAPAKPGPGREAMVWPCRHFGTPHRQAPHGGHQACHGGLFVFCIQISGQTRFALPGGIIFLPQQRKLLWPACCKRVRCFVKPRNAPLPKPWMPRRMQIAFSAGVAVSHPALSEAGAIASCFWAASVFTLPPQAPLCRAQSSALRWCTPQAPSRGCLRR